MSKEQLACHEAAHAVIREVLGGSVHYVSIYNANNSHVRVERSCSVEADEHVVIMSGMVAEFAFFPFETASANGGGHYGGDDWERVPEDARRPAAERAKQLVREHRQAISAIADKLLAELFVSGEQVRQAIKENNQP